MDKIIILVVLAVFYVIIEFTYGGKSKFQKDTFKDCTDPIINNAFETAKIKGTHFIIELLHSLGIRSFSLRLHNKSGSSAMVYPHSLTINLNADYWNILDVRTFQICVHEVKHVLDKKILRLTILPFVLYILSMLFAIFSTTSFFKGINVKDFYSEAFWIGVVSLTVYIPIKILIEVRAIKYVPSVCRDILSNYGFSLQEQDSIYNYLYSRSLRVLKWYPANLIQQFIILTAALDFFYLIVSVLS